MKRIFSICGSILFIIIVLGVSRNFLIKASVEKSVKFITGLELRLENLYAGITNTQVTIEGLQLFNPKGYQDRVMLDIPEISVDYNLSDIIKGDMHLEEIRIHLKEFTVIKNEKGELNLDSLKVVQAQKKGQTKPVETKASKSSDIRVDSLSLKVGKVIYKDYSQGGDPSVRVFNINLDEKYKNITDPNKLVSLIVTKALMKTTIANLTNFDLRGLSSTVSDLATGATGALGQTSEVAKEAIGKTAEAVLKMFEQK